MNISLYLIFTGILNFKLFKKKDIGEKYSIALKHSNLLNTEIKDSVYKKGLYNVLIIGNNMELLFHLKNSLASIFNVYFSPNGVRAAKKIKEIPRPDVIVSDIMMDKMNGFNFYEKVIKTNINYNSIPFMFLSARASEKDKIKGISMGAIDFITKPFSKEMLKLKLKSIISNRKNSIDYFSEKLKNNLFNAIINKLNIKYKYKPALRLASAFKSKYGISKREKEVILLLIQGFEYKEISGKLKISKNTVETYRKRIFKKCNVQNKTELLGLLSTYSPQKQYVTNFK